MIFTTENGTFGTCSEGTNYKVKHTNKIEFCPIKHATVQFVSPISCSMTVLLRVSWIMKQKVFIPQNRLFSHCAFLRKPIENANGRERLKPRMQIFLCTADDKWRVGQSPFMDRMVLLHSDTLSVIYCSIFSLILDLIAPNMHHIYLLYLLHSNRIRWVYIWKYFLIC